jgi:26S proteasome regulatory subunit N9
MELLDELVQTAPSLASLRDEIGGLLARKRWFEIGERFLDLLNDPAVTKSRRRIFTALIQRNGDFLDPYHYARLILSVADEAPTPDLALEFLQSKDFQSARIFDRFPQWRILLNIRVAELHTQKGDYEQALKDLLEIESRLGDGASLVIRANFHLAQSNLDKQRRDFDAFYEHAFLYLSTGQPGSDASLAYDLCVAALLADNVCSFGELAVHPILSSLHGTEQGWLADLIRLLDAGAPSSVGYFAEHFAPLIQESETFAPHFTLIERKVALSVFMQLIFQRPFNSRVFSFEEIADACQIEIEKVEHLVLKALAADIIRGTIDEVEQKVTVTWSKPKALGIDRLTHLKEEIDRWVGIVHRQRISLGERAHPVVGS